LKIILVVILGDVNVGKSNIIRRILGHDFQELEATVGVEFGLIDVKNIDPDDPNVVLSIQIWDTCKITYFNFFKNKNLFNLPI
jgi:GTPase SAR1 family protein